jgi:hypothetical protein
MRSITRAPSPGHHDRDFLLSASSNGIFIDLFSINGWLLQIFAVQILLTHKSLVDSLVLAYPIVMILELFALLLPAYINYQKLLIASFALRSLLVVAMLIPAYLGMLPHLVPVLYYVAFFFHIVGLHVCWPLYVKKQIIQDRRGYVLGLARAYTNIFSLGALLGIFLAAKFAQDFAALVGLAASILASGLALSGIHQGHNQPPAFHSDSRHDLGEQSPVLGDLRISFMGLAAEKNFRKTVSETLSIGIIALPLPLLFLPQTGLISNSNIVLAFMFGTGLSILAFPPFGKLVDKAESKAHSLAIITGAASTLLIGAVLFFQDVLSWYVSAAGAFLGIVANFLTIRLGALFTYKRALETAKPAATAASAIFVGWIFDLAVWSVVAAMQFLSIAMPEWEIRTRYFWICFASAAASIFFFVFARQQRMPQHV